MIWLQELVRTSPARPRPLPACPASALPACSMLPAASLMPCERAARPPPLHLALQGACREAEQDGHGSMI